MVSAFQGSWKESKGCLVKSNYLHCYWEHSFLQAKFPKLWPPNVKSWLIGKGPVAEKDWGQEEKGTTEDEIGWLASPTQWVWANPGRQWRTKKTSMLPCGHKESATTEWLNNNTTSNTAHRWVGYGGRTSVCFWTWPGSTPPGAFGVSGVWGQRKSCLNESKHCMPGGRV